MSDPILLELRDVTAALLRDRKITKGHWFLAVQFGLAATYVPAGPNGAGLPAAIVPVQKIGLRESETPTDVTVDAAQLAAQATPSRSKRSKKRPTQAAE